MSSDTRATSPGEGAPQLAARCVGTVDRVIRETPQAVTLVMDVPGWPGHKAGQHVATKGEPVTRVSLTAMQLAGAPVGDFGAGAMKTARPMSEVMA